MALVTYQMAVDHLKQNGVLDLDGGSPDVQNDDLNAKIEQASAMVLIHLKRHGEWDVETDADTDPEFAVVQAAVLKVLGNLYRFRGDDENSPSPIDDNVARMLSMLRDPTLA